MARFLSTGICYGPAGEAGSEVVELGAEGAEGEAAVDSGEPRVAEVGEDGRLVGLSGRMTHGRASGGFINRPVLARTPSRFEIVVHRTYTLRVRIHHL
jgi:hypothetical protein